MDTLTSAIVSVLSFIASLIGNVVAADICSTADKVCTKIIGRAVARLAPFDREEKAREWLSVLAEFGTVFAKYRHAIGCYLAAPRMRRRAMTLVMDVKFIVPSVGTVPMTLTIDPVVGQSIVNLLSNRLVRKPVIVLVFIYHFIKLARTAHTLGPGQLHRFLNEFNNFKKWDFEFKVRHKNFDLDLSKYLKLWVLDRQKGSEMFERLADILTKKQEENFSAANPRLE